MSALHHSEHVADECGDEDLLLRSAERNMLEYMRHASGVRRIGFESYRKDVVVIVSRYMQIVCTCFVVLKVQRRQLQFRDMLRALKGEAMKLRSRLREIGEVSNRGVVPSPGEIESTGVRCYDARRTLGSADRGEHRC